MAPGRPRMEPAKEPSITNPHVTAIAAHAPKSSKAVGTASHAVANNTAMDPKIRAALLCLAASVGSGAMLWACFQPLAWGSYLGWIALVPFLVLVRSQARPSFVYLCAMLCGLAFFLPALQWMRVADRSMTAGWICLASYCAFYYPVALFGVRRLERWNLPLVVSVPLVWVALEYVRCFLMTGFPWYLLAHTQHDLLPMIQITDIGGVFLVSFVVVVANAFLFDLAYQFPEIREWFNQAELEPYRYYSNAEILNRGILAECLFRRNLIVEGTVVVIVLISTYIYGETRISQAQFRPGPLVCLLQSNLDQRLRESALAPDRNGYSVPTMEKHFAELCLRAAFNNNPKADLLIWPETSFPSQWYEISRNFPAEKLNEKKFRPWVHAEIDIRDRLNDLAGKHTQIPHLLGMNANQLDADGNHRKYNSALLLKPVLQPNGQYQGRIDGKFDKVHRLPFGEYIPMNDWLPFLQWFTPYEGPFGIQQGEKLTRFEIAKHRFGVLLCFEDTDPFLARRYMETTDDGPPVDFLVNMSNDGWFDGSSEHEEHLAVSRFRAIECRRSMVRAVNMGVSAVIDGNGRVLKPEKFEGTFPPVWMVKEHIEHMEHTGELPIADWHKFKQTQMILKANVPIDHRFSFYAATGDWLPVGCWLVLLGGAGWALVRRRMTPKAA